MKGRKKKTKRDAFVRIDASSFVFLKGGKLKEHIKMKFDGGLSVPGDRVLFMLSPTAGEGLLQVPRERKSLLVQCCTDRSMYDQRWGTIHIFFL